MPHRDPNARRAADRERHRRRVAARQSACLCVRCGRQPPVEGGRTCEACRQQRREDDARRAERRRNAGIKRVRDPQVRQAEYRRARQRAEDRLARGLCSKCGRSPHEPGRKLCAACAGRRRAAERARYREASQAGLKFGGKKVAARRLQGRRRSRRRRQTRRDAQVCVRCGRQPPVDGRTSCEDCLIARRAAEKATYNSRRSAGLCVRCGIATFQGEALCGPCAVADARRQPGRNAAARRRYHDRRVRQICTRCGIAPSFGASRCEPCARKEYARSGHVRGLPVYGAGFTVVHVGTSETLGDYESWEDVVLCLSFAGLSFEEVDILTEHAPMQPVLTGFS